MIKTAEADLTTVNLTRVMPGQVILVTFNQELGTNNHPKQIVLTVTKAAQMRSEEGQLPWGDCALATMPIRYWNSATLDPDGTVNVQVRGVFPAGSNTREAMKDFMLSRLLPGYRLFLSSVGRFPRGWFMPDPIEKITVR